MNALPDHIVANQLAQRPIDPYAGILPTDSHVAVSLLALTLGVPRKALRDGLQLDTRQGSTARITMPGQDRLKHATKPVDIVGCVKRTLYAAKGEVAGAVL